jgi:D-alanine-D-alanine ligase
MSTRTIVLFGGPSEERHVSVAEAQHIAATLQNADCWYWAPDGAVHDIPRVHLSQHEQPFTNEFAPRLPPMASSLESALDALHGERPAFFITLGGIKGEDGTVQQMLAQRRLPFNGSGASASAAALDKARTKELLDGVLQLAESRVAHTAEMLTMAVDAMLERHPKVILKPLRGGSSCGVIVLDRDTPRPAFDRFDLPYMVERFIEGRELTAGVIDADGGPMALPVVEIEIGRGATFDYTAKYLTRLAREICPAFIDESLRNAAQWAALTAHTVLGCEGYSRTDLIAADDGLYFLELNSLPGLTASSLFPRALAAAGIDLSQFLADQMTLAARRAQ